ncbi:hypothetical protein [Parapedobacter sp. DT-150]|uniref:hypothetical protein n=1 Tax=Parapedobacter sp. DT-150 TaxID=3396162 RepID=UPI003F1A6F7C
MAVSIRHPDPAGVVQHDYRTVGQPDPLLLAARSSDLTVARRLPHPLGGTREPQQADRQQDHRGNGRYPPPAGECAGCVRVAYQERAVHFTALALHLPSGKRLRPEVQPRQPAGCRLFLLEGGRPCMDTAEQIFDGIFHGLHTIRYSQRSAGWPTGFR